ncbi:Mycolic acid cyclopropane synthetase-domain-containing protein [Halteromyces radiatus]|uniref:Mycolic acid cyclopropane synthetase-domain-containing protein n=1 Tax=Halteromyces radiatus TaxID=101107 RepID=UPI00222025F2|nr:Mycolic acid cyclopropane synthetase-domain-containing protein [Halteromyces radiatus]KAI8086795.1 Mycolic acid cyclopropane synthetase-domain-containing protein [Halteromyces radiatus]
MEQDGTYKPKTWAAIHNATYPAEGAGNQTFDNRILIGVGLGLPYVFKYYLGLSWFSYIVLTILFALPVLASVIYLYSRFAPRYRNRIRLPGKPLEEYMTIHDPELKQQYNGHNKIPMETFFEAYFEGKIDIKGDILEVFELRHDWAAFQFTFGQFKFFLTQWIPETFWHSRDQDENQVRDHYDRGNDFYEAFLGPLMVYTSGIISDATKRETLEQMQENKMDLICNKIHLKKGEKHLDIGCGWGTLTAYASKHYGSDSTGVTLAKNQTEFGNKRCEEWGVKDTARINCMDYRDIPSNVTYDKITCVEMAEHVGLRRFPQFLHEVRELLDDDGLFYMQVAGLRATWQYEDFIWGLFMARYIFPGADASTPLYWYIKQLETAGFEIQNVDTVGVHYSSTLEKWYLNWMKNRDDIRAKYGDKITRVWDIFLAWSTIISRQGSATCFQIVANKNRNSFDRAALINNRTNPSAWKSQNE